MSNNNQLKSKTLLGLFWSFTELVSKQGIQLLVQIVLARLLLPEHFGLIGMITIFIAISAIFVQSGLDQALIREKNPGTEDYSTVFYFNLVISIVVYIIMYLSAPIIADFFKEPKLVEILRVIMVVVIINAFAVIQRVILIRKVDFKTQTKISIIAGITSGTIAVIMALMGAGVWSLVAQQVTMQSMEAILLIVSNRWVPSFTFNFTLFKQYFNFGYKLLFSGLISTIQKNIYFVIIGKMYPVTQLGYFTNATKLRDVSAQSISQAIQKVTYPVLSRFKDDNKRLSVNYIRLIRCTAFVYFPIITILAAVAPIVIPMLLGELWEPSVPYFQLLCIVGLLYPIQALNLNVLKVKGRTDIVFMLSIIKIIVLFLLLGLIIKINDTIIGIIIAAILMSFIAILLHCYYASKYIEYRMSRQLFHLSKIMVSSSILFIIVNLTRLTIDINSITNLILQVVLGLGAYLLISLLINKWELKNTINLFSKQG
ncbi:lipopolysaccharide biosynthesis protein [Virgibacillus siamensis]|uniref:Lipopolysaccharide biosynthesis protein n=1 Tax=Virgibacillus siamensis TaxID=480071 RepID=A0ABP3RAU0_9BACI